MPAVGRNGTKPKSLVEHLSDQAPKRPVNDIVSLDRYLMSAQLLLKQAADYRQIGHEEQLYVMLLRFASLVVETIPNHRDFRDSNSSYKTLKKDLLVSFLPELERLKASLRLKDRAEPPTATSRNRPADAVQLSVSALPQLDWASSGAPPVLSAPPLASLASRQSSSSLPPGAGVAAVREGVPQVGPPTVDDLLEIMGASSSAAVDAIYAPPATAAAAVAAATTAAQPPADPYALAAAAAASLSAASTSPNALPQPKYAQSYAASLGSRHALFGAPPQQGGTSSGGSWRATGLDQQPQLQRSPTATSGVLLPRYPVLGTTGTAAAVALVEPSQLSCSRSDRLEQVQQQLAMASLQPSAGPLLGPQEVQVFQLPPSTHGLPDTCSVTHGAPCQLPQLSPLPATPTPSSTSPTSSICVPPPSGGGPKEVRKLAQLRDVHVSVALMEEFLHYARSNTSRGIESCGVLAGRLLAGDSRFAITTLIIPKQQGTTDTVQALNEEEIFEAQFSRELYPLGWIHTHPRQTCFLSSVDVHTQCGYQTMLEEAVAIVMAPTDVTKKCGIFRLSSPGGLSLVQKCPERGFHSHPPTDTGQDLYELCGHVYLNPRAKHEVLDLR